MSNLTVAVPVLWRPQRISAVMEAFKGVNVLFLPDEDDKPTIDALREHKAWYSIAHKSEKFGVPTYETKVNHAYRITDSPFVMYASDDVEPQGDWWTRALNILRTKPHVGLLATNDNNHPLVRKGKLATHGIIRRSYVEEYGTASLPDAGPIFFEGYRHWGCDAEASYVARMRGAFHYDEKVRVLHRHVRNRYAEEKTYAIGRAHANSDRALLMERCPTWPEVPT